MARNLGAQDIGLRPYTSDKKGCDRARTILSFFPVLKVLAAPALPPAVHSLHGRRLRQYPTAPNTFAIRSPQESHVCAKNHTGKDERDFTGAHFQAAYTQRDTNFESEQHSKYPCCQPVTTQFGFDHFPICDKCFMCSLPKGHGE